MNDLTEEEVLVLETVKRFAREKVAPEASRIEWIEDHAKRFPWRLVEEASRLGLRTIGVPKEYGGLGSSTVLACAVVEELAAADMSFAIILEQTWKVSKLIFDFGNEEQKEWFLKKFMGDDRFLLGIAGTESAVGSDRILPYDPAKLRTTGTPQGDSWILNGVKNFISNGADAKMFLVYANTDSGAPLSRSLSVFMVPTDTPGFRVGTIEDKISQRVVSNAELIFENCRIPKNQLLGEANRGGEFADRFVPRSRVGAAATVLGTARAAYDAALQYAMARVQGGSPIIEHSVIGCMIAEMASRLEAVRSMTRTAARSIDDGSPEAFEVSHMAKYIAAEDCIGVCTKALQMFGHLGIVRGSPIQKYVRDALSFYHSEATQQVVLLKILDTVKRERGGGKQ